MLKVLAGLRTGPRAQPARADWVRLGMFGREIT